MMTHAQPDPLMDGLRRALRAEIDRIAAEEQEAAVERVRRRVAESLDTLAVGVLSQYAIERHQHEIVIRVDKRALAGERT